MRLSALLVVSLVVHMGCGSSTSQEGDTTPAAPAPTPAPAPAPPPPPPQPVEVSLRVIHAAGLARAATLNASVAGQGSSTSVASGLAYGSAGTYTSVTLAPQSSSLPLSVEAEGFDALSESSSITAGDPHTAIVFSSPDGGTALGAAIVHDSTQAADSGSTRVRFFHAVVGWNDVDVCAPGATARDAATPLFPGATYGHMAADYADLPDGVLKVQVREAKPDAPCTGRVLGSAELAAPEGQNLDAKNVTLVATGRGSGRPAVPRALLLCLDSPTSPPACASQPMRAR